MLRSRSRRHVIWAVVIVVTASIGALLGRHLMFDDQWRTFDGLRQTAAIVFGVSGAYVAIVYPATLKSLGRRGLEVPPEKTAFDRLLNAMELSFAVLAAVLFIGLFAPAVRHNSWCMGNAWWICPCSYAVAGILTVIQFWAIVCLLVPLDEMTRKVGHEETKRGILNALPPSADRSGVVVNAKHDETDPA